MSTKAVIFKLHISWDLAKMQILVQQVWGGARGSAFVRSSRGMLMLLHWDPHFAWQGPSQA